MTGAQVELLRAEQALAVYQDRYDRANLALKRHCAAVGALGEGERATPMDLSVLADLVAQVRRAEMEVGKMQLVVRQWAAAR